MKKIFIQQHLGLGDNIVHNGMIRKLSLDNPDYLIYVPSKTHNFDNVKFMYRDNNKIIVIDVIDDYGMNKIIVGGNYDKIISPYLIGQNIFRYDKYFDDAFYLKINMDPQIKKDFFYVKRNLNKEIEIYNNIIKTIGNTKFNLIHEDFNTKRLIDRSKIKNNLPNFVITKNFNFFDLLYTIEMCEEFHIISSSFLSLSTCKKFNQKTYAHLYTGRNELSNYIIKNDIEIIN